jgi:hypothetical protein
LEQPLNANQFKDMEFQDIEVQSNPSCNEIDKGEGE